MSRGTNQKFKFTYLMKIMLAKTDDDHEMVVGIFDLILETVLSKNDEITIAGDVYPKNLQC